MIECKSNEPRRSKTRGTILELLKRRGPADSKTLAQRLRLSAMGVRQHLYTLRDEGLVSYDEEHRAVGRPAKVWRVTKEAAHLFPNGHAALGLGVLQEVKRTFGEEGLTRLLGRLAQKQIRRYRQHLPRNGTLRARLQALARLRSSEGYMAEVLPTQNGFYIFAENHCPICEAAAGCAGLCEMEIRVFRALLGKTVVIERNEHALNGERRCAYKIGLRSDIPGKKTRKSVA